MFFNNSSSYPIGLDISDLSIKLVQLNKIREKIKIQAIGKINLPPGLIEDGEIKNQAEVIKYIKKIIDNPKYGKVSSEEIVACLPESKTFIKLIEIPKSPNTLGEIIEIEIEKYIPMPINDIYYDWQIIKDLSDKQLVLIGAAPKNVVNQYTDMIDKAKLSVLALEIEPVAISRSLLAEENPASDIAKDKKNISRKNSAIIDIGANHTCMIFYSKDTILFTVSMPISGEEVTSEIAQTLQITAEQAEKAKIICGLDEDRAKGIIKNILSDTIKELIKKINEAIEFYNHHFHERGALDQILLCGGGANIKNLAKIINENTSAEVKMGDSLASLAEEKEKFYKILEEKHSLGSELIKKNNTKIKNETLSIVQSASPTFSTAIGLALRGIFVDGLK